MVYACRGNMHSIFTNGIKLVNRGIGTFNSLETALTVISVVTISGVTEGVRPRQPLLGPHCNRLLLRCKLVFDE